MPLRFPPVKITLDHGLAFILATFVLTEVQGSHDFSRMLTDAGRKELIRIAQSILDQVATDPAENEIVKKPFLSDN